MIDLLYPAKPAPVMPAPRSYMVDENIGQNEEMLPVVEPSGVVVGQMARCYAHSGSNLLHPVVHLHIIINYDNNLFLCFLKPSHNCPIVFPSTGCITSGAI